MCIAGYFLNVSFNLQTYLPTFWNSSCYVVFTFLVYEEVYTHACPLFASEWYNGWPLWRVVKLSSFLRTSPSPITSHFILSSFSASSISCSSFSIGREYCVLVCVIACVRVCVRVYVSAVKLPTYISMRHALHGLCQLLRAWKTTTGIIWEYIQ